MTMKAADGAIIRPLLWADRRTIEHYIAEQGYDFVEDTTNASTEYTRNKIRHQVVPLLEEINPKSVAHLCAAAEKLSSISEYIDREAKKLQKRCVTFGSGEVRIEKAGFEEADTVLQVPVLQSCIEYLSNSLANVCQEHFDRLTELFSMQTGKELCLPYEISAVRTYDGIRLSFRKKNPKAEPVEITGAGEWQFGGRIFEVSVENWDTGKIFPIKTYTKCFDYDKIKGTVFLRTRETGTIWKSTEQAAGSRCRIISSTKRCRGNKETA